MNFRVRAVLFSVVALLSFPPLMKAPVVFKPSEGAKYIVPGEEKLSGNAKELFEEGQKAEARGDLKRAIAAYKSLVKRYPRDALASGALFRGAELEEKRRAYIPAAQLYRVLVEKFPTSPHFNEAIEAQFRIGEIYLAGKRLKLLGIPMASALDHAIEIFAAVVRTAPYGKYTARAQFDIGLAREKQRSLDAALDAYQAVVDKFPNEPVAADAQYQIGYIWLLNARAGAKDIAATIKAKTAFQDFLFRYPNSEKAGQARSNLKLLEGKQTTSAFKTAQFYDKQKQYRAAVIYYNEVIRQQPGSKESGDAKKRIDELRKKFGEAALQPAFVKAEAEAAKKKEKEKTSAPAAEPGPPATTEDGLSRGAPPPDASPKKEEPESSSAPPASSPPPAIDLALPPSGLTPDRKSSDESSSLPEPTATPEVTATPESTATPEASSSPEESPTPEASASPTL